jgi:isopentenyldiphosphate isomerase
LGHVFGGVHDGDITPDPTEVDDYRWIGLDALEADMVSNPSNYTAWFLEYLRLRRENIADFLQSH